jgi:hypothetical protein
MVLTGVPRKLTRHALRVWQDIAIADVPHGVFIVRDSVKTVPVSSPAVQQQLDRMIDDLPDFFVGVFDRKGSYQQFLSDVAVTANLIDKRGFS